MTTKIYPTDQRHEYDPGPCPKCGGTDVHVNWVDVSTSAEGLGSLWVPGQLQCLNPLCEWGPPGIPIRSRRRGMGIEAVPT
jgi:hypothetical protein